MNLNGTNCEYYTNKRAWLIETLFKEYVQQLDGKMDDRKFILLVGNCLTRPKIAKGLKY